MPKSQSTASKKARAAQSAAGGKHTTHLRAQTCGRRLDPWGVLPARCARPPHDTGLCSSDPAFDQAAWERQQTVEQEAAERRWEAMTPEQRQHEYAMARQEEEDLERAALDAEFYDPYDPDED